MSASASPAFPSSSDEPPKPTLEERYRDLFESALLGIYVSDPGGRLIACNAAFASQLAFESVSDAVGTNMASIYADPADRAEFVGQVRDQGRLEHLRTHLVRRDGQVIDVLETVVGAFDAAGTLTELRGFLIDVTERTLAERALAERERRFRSVFVDAADAMLILDDDRTILEANPAACALVGLDADALPGKTLDWLLGDDVEALASAWGELLALGEAKREHRVRHHRAETRVVECTYRARVHGGRHLCIARDITDRRLVESHLMQAERIESIGRLAGGIAHDFNNLLTAILGYTELLLDQHVEPDPDRHDLIEIQRAGQRAASLTQQLLAFSRKQVLVPKDLDLNEIVAGLTSMLSRLIREDISLSVELLPTPAMIRIDPAQVEQAILNLVLNARDAIRQVGHIRLQVTRALRSQVDVPADLLGEAAEYIGLRVVDDGIGMAPNVRAHLFEPFFTTKAFGDGTGLGLASVYGIVRQSHGFISVESEPGVGTTFTMQFPAVPRGHKAAANRSEPSAGAGERETILLVEDEEAVRAVIGTILRRQGYRVLEAATPLVAWAIFEKHQNEIDLLLTDVVMPEMNGPALAQGFIGRRPDLRVLLISGYADIVAPLDLGGPHMGFLGKPFRASALTEKVGQMLTGARQERP